jgi:RimJ/RimL family protein N-acetyltransferase
MTAFPTGAPLPPEVVARRDALPLKPDPVVLTGAHVALRPLDLERDVAALHAVSNGQPARLGDRSVEAYDPEMIVWRYMGAGPFASADELGRVLRAQVEAPNGLCLCVHDRATDRPVGVVTYMNNFPEHLKVELGNIWYSPLVQRSKANVESTHLLLGHAFDLGYRRVEWKCDSLNERSRRSALRMGFRFEGIQEAHFIVKGRNRDTAWFRILDREWPEVRARLERMIAE